MDSVTQAALGAVVAHAAIGSKKGRWLLLVGALLATLPDLDLIFSPFLTDVQRLLFHRGYTHSFVVHMVVSPIFAYFLRRFLWPDVSFVRLLVMVFLVFSTHALIDWFNLYGTQILKPLSEAHYNLGVLFIIDPLFTLPLLVAVVWALYRPRQISVSYVALACGVLYVLLAFGFKMQAETRLMETLKAQGVVPERIESGPGLFNILLWRVMAVKGNAYWEGEYGVFDSPGSMVLRKHSRMLELFDVAGVSEHAELRQLKYFTHGFFRLRVYKDALLMQDIRLGVKENMFFSYVLAKRVNNGWQVLLHPTQIRYVSSEGISLKKELSWTFNRIFEGQE